MSLKSKSIILLACVTLSLSILIAVAAVFIAWTYWMPNYAISHIEAALSEACPKCTFHIEALSTDLFNSTVTLDSVSFDSDPADSTAEKVKVGRLVVGYNLQELVHKKIDLVDLQMNDLVVTIEEKYDPRVVPVKAASLARLEETYGGRFLESLPELIIRQIKLRKAKLEYVLKIYDKRATFTVSDINANISELGTRASVSPRFTSASLTGVVQGSGSLKFKCRADLYSVKNEDQIEIELRHQKMSDLNSFFMNEDGLQMDGEIEKALAIVSLDRGMLTGVLSAEYHDLSIHVNPTRDTSKFKAFLTNLFSGLKIAPTKNLQTKAKPVAQVNYKRLPGQGLIKFILAGLKEAAMQVVAK